MYRDKNYLSGYLFLLPTVLLNIIENNYTNKEWIECINNRE